MHATSEVHTAHAGTRGGEEGGLFSTETGLADRGLGEELEFSCQKAAGDQERQTRHANKKAHTGV